MRQKYLTAFRRCSFRCVSVGVCLDDNPSETHNFRPNKRNPSSSRSHAVQNTMRCSSPLNCARRRRSRLCPSRDIPGLKALVLEPCLRGGTNVRFSLRCPTMKRTFCPFSVPPYGQAVLVASVLALPIADRSVPKEGDRCSTKACAASCLLINVCRGSPLRGNCGLSETTSRRQRRTRAGISTVAQDLHEWPNTTGKNLNGSVASGLDGFKE